ncbi:MAG: porin [Ottowia sp.]|nr:porin [Ottowia sp.]
MKKTLVALAALGACGLAAAQSSVTVYGTADGGIGRVVTPIWSGTLVDTSTRNPLGVIGGVPMQATDPVTGCLLWDNNVRFTGGGGLMNHGYSRLGLKGAEDIGGGNYVGFQFETGLRLDDGSSYIGHEWGGFWGRHANVFIYGDWGTVKLGRQPSVTDTTEGVYELTGLANYSVVRNTFSVNGFVSRVNSAISYTTPSMGGLQAAVAFISKNNLEGARLGKNVWDAGLWYSNGPLGIGASVNNGLDNGKKNYHVGAKFSFGDHFALAASYHRGTSDGIARPNRGFWDAGGNLVVIAGGVERVRRGYGLGAQARFGAFTVTLDVTRDTRNEWTGAWNWSDGVGNWVWSPEKYTNAVLEGKYALSKRSFLYGAVLRLDGLTHWGLGINHSF